MRGLWCSTGVGILTAFMGCSDYEVRTVKDPEPDPDGPAIAVDPESVDVGATCATHTANINVSNTGDLPLTIED